MAVSGPSGGTGGGAFTDPEDTFRVARVTIRTGLFVDSVQMTHERPDGSLVTFPHRGGFGGNERSHDLAVGEHIIRVDGRFGVFVDSIDIFTDRGQSLPGGGRGGRADYRYEAPGGYEIVGFVGRSGIFVDAIGVILRALPSP
jgi:hypothetical protein